jgi:lipid II:glycine glycyltransferase (peptidoglycan interpeptide bridge formation enzyme)
MDLQQSSLYKKYIESLGWSVTAVDGSDVFYRKLPLIGTFAKIQRPEKLPYLPKLIPFLKKLHVRTVAVEPTSQTSQEEFSRWVTGLGKFFRLTKEPFLPTKTILVDLTPSEESIFKKFTEAKQRAVRRAGKHNIIIEESHDIKDLTSIKNKSAGMFGAITTHGMDRMWKLFAPEHAAIFLAYKERSCVGGVLLLFWEDIAYYWIAGATKNGKKLFAPTLLLWEALKYSKKRGMKQFDFIGVWDERTPKQFTSWKGFTKFKEGFGGTTLYYPIRKSLTMSKI